ncbi:copper homeostasis membrane protein CopD [Sphingomonas bacterium]|uniref:copper homeostasis membrane protein CopD n=1 Tax=Sphingomonas bacterium TaxID=1895847 RepID=UPI0020C5FBFB|nr:copper homeostasis membrane protein CopD [Sphingomonas bacterium]
MIAIRLALYLTLCAAAGVPAALLLLTPGTGEELPGRARAAFRFAPAVAMLASLVSLPVLAAGMAGTPAWPIDTDAVRTVLSETAVGTAWIVRTAALAIAIVAAAMSGRHAATVSGAGATLALATLAWSGHGIAGEGVAGWVHLAADIAHLLASGLWVGALLALAAMLSPPAAGMDGGRLRSAHQALSGFASIGTATVGVLALTGIVNGWFLVGPGQVGTLGASLWGRLLLGKLALFAAMLALAALNRWLYGPALRRSIDGRDPAGALILLRRSLLAETGCAIAVLALVAWLGTLEPPNMA